MEQENHYRHELKFAIPYSEYLAIRGRLKAVMSTDPHVSENGTYQIRSIYFDNRNDKALREKIDGVAKREKFRIRYYNDDFSFITLEKNEDQRSLSKGRCGHHRGRMQKDPHRRPGMDEIASGRTGP